MVKQASAVKANRAEMLNDFYSLSIQCCKVGDYDPFHLLLRHLKAGMSTEQSLWFSCLFIAHYNIGSAIVHYQDQPIYKFRELRMPIEPARRALFGGRIYKHLGDLVAKAKAVGGLNNFFRQGLTGGASQYNWDKLRENISSVYGAGRWASYTFAEVLQKVHDFPVIPTDMGLEGASGPKAGLKLLMNGETSLEMATLRGLCRKHVNPTIPWFDYAVLESCACDFNSLNKGRYYIGRDIDREQYRNLRAEATYGKPIPELWEAREAVFQPKYLGELNGWEGIDKQRLTIYQKTGELIGR